MPITTLEWFLARFTTRDRANAAIGDLLELSGGHTSCAFYASYLRILARTAAPQTFAWIASYIVGCSLLYVATLQLPMPMRGTFAAEQVATSPAWVIFQVISACFLLQTLFAAPYFLARFGLRDKLTRLCLALAIGSYIPIVTCIWLYPAMAAELLAPAILVVAFILPSTRRALATILIASTAALTTLTVVWVNFLRYNFKGSIQQDLPLYITLHIAGLLSLWIFTTICGALHNRWLPDSQTTTA
jgi:hypothetical protein